MSNKTYADECLERAEKATGGPWTASRDLMTFEVFTSDYGNETICTLGPEDSLSEEHDDDVFGTRWHNAEFIIHAHTDVSELAKRLKQACKTLRTAANYLGDESLRQLAEELEAPVEQPDNKESNNPPPPDML